MKRIIQIVLISRWDWVKLQIVLPIGIPLTIVKVMVMMMEMKELKLRWSLKILQILSSPVLDGVAAARVPFSPWALYESCLYRRAGADGSPYDRSCERLRSYGTPFFALVRLLTSVSSGKLLHLAWFTAIFLGFLPKMIFLAKHWESGFSSLSRD